MTTKKTIIVWFRRDLRLTDNPALHWATQQKRPVLCVYINDTQATDDNKPGGASRWWLHHSLLALDSQLSNCGNKLHLISGSPDESMYKLVEATGADTVVWNRRYEPSAIALDSAIKKHLIDIGHTVTSFPGNYCHEPWQVQREGKHPYKVFTAYWRASLKHATLAVAGADTDTATDGPEKILCYRGKGCSGVNIESLGLLPTLPWADQFADTWQPGEAGAAIRLQQLLDGAISHYSEGRDLPAVEGTSRLSPHLAFGEISPRQITAAIADRVVSGELKDDDNTETYRKEIGWRDFACHLLYHFPHTTENPLDVRFKKFPWKKNKKALQRWQQGNTGIPLVDAGMRQLWQTGWMHNRVRMVVGSLLIKNMGIHWLEGARWFWDTLLDADLASNTMGWQWVAGSGADAAPYFRVFNPVRQGERFDPDGDYIRQWVPEIAKLGKKTIHAPWTASDTELANAGIVLGKTYPKPIVDLAQSRKDALERFGTIKSHA